MRFQTKEKHQVSKLNQEVGADIAVTDRYFKPGFRSWAQSFNLSAAWSSSHDLLQRQQEIEKEKQLELGPLRGAWNPKYYPTLFGKRAKKLVTQLEPLVKISHL